MRARVLRFSLITVIGAIPHLGSSQVFPDVKDMKDVTVTLHRGGPMGGGPSYKLTISGGGVVQYEGYGGVSRRGRRIGHISKARMNQLIGEFRKARFFALQDSYSSAATDLPFCDLGFEAGPINKKVVDYGFHASSHDSPEGFLSGAPPELIELENKVDEMADSRKWTKGSVMRRILHWH